MHLLQSYHVGYDVCVWELVTFRPRATRLHITVRLILIPAEESQKSVVFIFYVIKVNFVIVHAIDEVVDTFEEVDGSCDLGESVYLRFIILER